jgi:hypothetical protein
MTEFEVRMRVEAAYKLGMIDGFDHALKDRQLPRIGQISPNKPIESVELAVPEQLREQVEKTLQKVNTDVMDIVKHVRYREVLQERDKVQAYIYASFLSDWDVRTDKTYTEAYNDSLTAAREFVMHKYGKLFVDAEEWEQK